MWSLHPRATLQWRLMGWTGCFPGRASLQRLAAMNRRSNDEAKDEDHGITGDSWCRHWQGSFSPRWLGHRWDNRLSPKDPAVEPQRCVRAAATVRRWHGGLLARTFCQQHIARSQSRAAEDPGDLLQALREGAEE